MYIGDWLNRAMQKVEFVTNDITWQLEYIPSLEHNPYEKDPRPKLE